MITEIDPQASVVLDASGNGQVALPVAPGATAWFRLASSSVPVTTNNPAVFWYRGSSSGPLGAPIDSSFNGQSASTGFVAAAKFFPGQLLWAVWQGGDPGARATLQAWGQQGQRGDPFEPPSVGQGALLTVANALQIGVPGGAYFKISPTIAQAIVNQYAGIAQAARLSLTMSPDGTGFYYEIVGENNTLNRYYRFTGWVNFLGQVMPFDTESVAKFANAGSTYSMFDTATDGNPGAFQFGGNGTGRTILTPFDIYNAVINFGLSTGGDAGNVNFYVPTTFVLGSAPQFNDAADFFVAPVFHTTVEFAHSVTMDINATVKGILTAANIFDGNVSITPTALNTPKSATITFPTALTGSTFTCVVGAHTGVPQNVSVGIASPSSTGVTVTLTRSDSLTATTIDVKVTGQ